MKKQLTWKQLLLIALALYASKILFGWFLPRFVVVAIELGGFITLIAGCIYGIKALFSKNKKSKEDNKK